MSSDVVIRAEGLGKKFVIGHQAERESYVALRDVIARNARNLMRTAGDLVRGRPNVVGDTVEEFWAMRGLDFEVRRGEVVGVIGRNGAGKSTLLKVLSRITEPTEGRVEIHGRVASLLEVGTGFHPELTGRENIYLNGAVLGMAHAEIRRKFDEIVAFAEVEKFLDTPVKRYSSGMYVRLAFAVAAHLEPEILIIDEVLAVGDAEFQKKCLGKMGEVASHGRTVVFVSHNMAAVAALCPHSFLLDKGRIVFSGPSSQAIGRYMELSGGRAIGADGGAFARDPAKRVGDAGVMAVQFVGPSRTGIVESGAALAVEIDVAVGVQDIPLSVFVCLLDCTGDVMCKFESDPKVVRFVNGSPNATALLEIEALPCMQGEYALGVGVAHFGSNIIEYVEYAAQLTVTAARDPAMKIIPGPRALSPPAITGGWRPAPGPDEGATSMKTASTQLTSRKAEGASGVRLLILTPEFELGGGIATFYRHLAPALGRLDVEVRVIEGSAFHAGAAASRLVEGARVETLEIDRLNRWAERFSALAAAPSLRRHLAAAWAMWEQAGRGAEADVVEAADWGLLYVPPAIEASRPLVVQGHGSIGQISVQDPLAGEEVQGALARLVESAILARAPAVQSYSRANVDFWARETGRPVDMIRPALRTPLGAMPESISDRGLVAGRIQRWKGPDVLCQALALMGDAAPGVDWLGRDTPFNRRGMSTASELASRHPQVWGRVVRPAPPVSPDEVAGRQSRALFNLIPSDWDVFNFTVAEAMASGRPVVASTGAGASELVSEGETGFLFETGNAASLAAALGKLLATSPARLAEIGRAAREVVRSELDPGRVAETRLAAYRRAVEDFAQSPPSPIDGWIGGVCRPNAATDDIDEFLGQFPIRTLTRHVAGRLREKAVAPLRTRRP